MGIVVAVLIVKIRSETSIRTKVVMRKKKKTRNIEVVLLIRIKTEIKIERTKVTGEFYLLFSTPT